MLKAVKYEILRQVKVGLDVLDLAVKPVRVATLLNEQDFLDNGGAMRHNGNVFLEDQYHDWIWENGKFRFFSRISLVADVLVVYELEKTA